MLDGALPEEVLNVKPEDLVALNVGLPGSARSRVNTWHNVLISMHKRTKALVAEQDGKAPFEPFPSLVVTADGIHARGSYAEAQVGKMFFCLHFKVFMNLVMESGNHEDTVYHFLVSRCW